MSINSITLVGRAGRDPEVRYFETGSCVANLSLAVNRRRDEKPLWFNLQIWGKQAQVAADYVRKGSLIGVIGSMDEETWTDRSTGEERTKPIVKVDRLELLGSKRDAEPGGPSGAAPEHPVVVRGGPGTIAAPARQAAPAPASGYEEEVPF